MKKVLFFLSLIFFLGIAFGVSADSVGESRNFFVDPNYDFYGREQILANLQRIGQKAYFYLDEQWWQDLSYQQKEEVKKAIENLDREFSQKIYPELTLVFGSEWKPGIDGDDLITVLIHPMKGEAGGYFNNGNEYPKLENPRSNEREMVYLNSDYLAGSLEKSFLAHEFVHLITFNQKEKKYGVQEEIWLNEARAEYAPTLLGYDSDYEGSNLQRRVRIFLENPSDSLTEWQGKKDDYGVLNIFTQYLVEQYGKEILGDSLRSPKTGIASLNEALKRRGYSQDFSRIFTDWTIAVLVNDCSLGEKYCYKNYNLNKIQVVPLLNFLPLQGKSTLGVSQAAKNWAGIWLKFIGGQGELKIEFIGDPNNLFRIPYLVKSDDGKYSLNFFQLSNLQRGEILIPGFGKEVNSIIIIPSIQTKTSGFLKEEPLFSFFWSASIISRAEEKEEFPQYLERPVSEMSASEILAKISEIEILLNQLRSKLGQINNPIETYCKQFGENLFYGLKNDNRVKCLQEFLKNQGPEIYPEGLVTGNFFSLTRLAVIRFQEKYVNQILSPWNLTSGTGFVGATTRAKINEILSQKF